jgi:DNA repair exonuclease SbcCD ATPase subunit
MITKEEIEKRLKSLEEEQENQNSALDRLKFLDDEIQRLEKELAEIEKYKLKSSEASQFERDNPETERLEKELAELDKEEQDNLKYSQQTSPIVSKKEGYIICLMFNPKAPPEWSGEGWVKPGEGTIYKLEEANVVLQELKKKWPNYPLKLI